jgi:heme A synthase
VVVVNELASWLVLVHLGLAMLILGLLLATAIMSLPPADALNLRFAPLAVAATYVLLLTGSTVVASGADESCRAWPLCGSGLAPSFAGADAFTMLHRGAVLILGIFILYVVHLGVRQPRTRGVAIATLAVFTLQVAVGAGSALTDAALFNGLHVALATLVWAGVLATALLTLPRTERVASLGRLAVDKGPA